MGNLISMAIPLKDISKDISSKLTNGTKKVLILSPTASKADELLKDFKEISLRSKIQAYFNCDIKICSEEESEIIYTKLKEKERLKKRKYENEKTGRYNITSITNPKLPKMYIINLHQIELTQ